MKIDGINPYRKVQEVTEIKKVNKKNDVQKTYTEKDEISLSEQAKGISELKAAIDELPDIRTDKVDSIKKAIDTGNYNVDSKKIAEKILEEI